MKKHACQPVQAAAPAPSQPIGDHCVEPVGRPFILDLMVSYPGAVNPTTTGTWDNMDGADYT